MNYLKYLILESKTPAEIHDKYYNWLEYDEFEQVAKSDPTTILDENEEIKKVGRYTKWMLKLLYNRKLLIEDLYKFTKILKLFNVLNNKGILKKNNIVADINHYKSLPELWSTIKEFHIEDSDEVLPVTSKEYELFFENEKCKIIIPYTHKASCYFGTDSEWCTANNDSKHYDRYTNDGPLFIIIDKTDTKNKYQFHIPSQSFADINDSMLESLQIIETLEYFDLYDENIVNKIFIKNSLFSSKNKIEIEIRGLIYTKSEEFENKNWHIIFQNWRDLGENVISMIEREKDIIFDILDYNAIDDRFLIKPYGIEDLYNVMVNKSVLDNILKTLTDLNPGLVKNEEFKNILNKYTGDVVFYYKEIDEFLKYFDKNSNKHDDISNKVSDIRRFLIYEYEELYKTKVLNYCTDIFIEGFVEYYNFDELPKYYKNEWIAPLSRIDILDLFVYSLDSDYEIYGEPLYFEIFDSDYEYVEANISINSDELTKILNTYFI